MARERLNGLLAVLACTVGVALAGGYLFVLIHFVEKWW